MGAERLRIMFRYRRGDRVGISGRQERYIVRRQCYETRDLEGLAPIITYTLEDEQTGVRLRFIDEPDILPAPPPKPLRPEHL